MLHNSWQASDFDTLAGVDFRLALVIFQAAENFTFKHPRAVRITEGVRLLARQRDLVRQGKSWTMKSKHLDGKAVDIAILTKGRERALWGLPEYEAFNQYVQDLCPSHGLSVTWGGSWAVRDGVHFELA